MDIEFVLTYLVIPIILAVSLIMGKEERIILN